MSVNRLFIQGISFRRGPQGTWQLSRMATNNGVFGIGQDENNRLDKEVVDRFCSYIVHEIYPLLEEFLDDEEKKTEQELIEVETERKEDQEDEQPTEGNPV